MSAATADRARWRLAAREWGYIRTLEYTHIYSLSDGYHGSYSINQMCRGSQPRNFKM
jgi:hypothetical protein